MPHPLSLVKAALLHLLILLSLLHPFPSSSAATLRKRNDAGCATNYFIHDLPDLPHPHPFRNYAGHININSATDSNIFFWLVKNHKLVTERQKLVIWLNGGPGCSSIEGLLLENGPMLLDKSGKPRINPHSWHHHANMLYVDQPVGTGFSYTNGTLATSQTEVGTQFVAFLEKFFDIFPDLQYSDVYFTGESFAGIYIPYIATEILKRNKEINETFTDSHTKLKWNLSGIAIGNGWIDPKNQYPAYIEYAAKHKLLSGTHNETAYTLTASCKSKYETSNSLRDLTCERIVDQITDYSKSGNQACMNIYDIRLRDPDNSGVCGASWPFDLPGVYTYLMNPEVVKFLHATNQTKPWRECDDEVLKQLDADRSPPSVTLLPELLKSGVPIHLFSGDMDMICNHIGTERMIENLEWNGAKGFGNVTSQAFSMNKNLIAHVTSARNLTYWLFYNSSHMVPIDQPAGSLAMLYRMIGVEEKYVGSEAYGQMGEEVAPPPPPTKKDYYYGAGTGALVVVVLFVVVLGTLHLRKKMRLRSMKHRDAEVTDRLVRQGREHEMDEFLHDDEEAVVFDAERDYQPIDPNTNQSRRR